MKIYNTLNRQLEQFKPQNSDLVVLYSCGPTVYDFAHIGNLRSFVFADTLRRALEADKYEIKHVMNITDVGHLSSDSDEGEDKLEAGAKRESKTVWDVANFYIEHFLKDIKLLNILEPNGYKSQKGKYPRATDFINDQIEIVKILLEKNYAYKTDEAIYFDVTKLSDYGKLSGQKLSDKEVGVRNEVIVDKNKHHPQDFALWFFKTGRFATHTMSWPTPWGEGFPGWHLECSAIIHATLGEPLDIHTGGVDHIGTHHTNEIAQTEVAYDVKLANYWMHNEHLSVDGQKMSKSKGNYYTLKDLGDKGYEPLALRLLFLQSHYRTQSNFTWESLEAAAVRLKNFRAFADLRFQANEHAMVLGDEVFDNHIELIVSKLSDDINTPEVLVQIDELIDKVNASEGLNPKDVNAHQRVVKLIDDIFGLDLLSSIDINNEQKELLKQRVQARTEKNWEESDSIRWKLTDQGIELSDTPNVQIWRRS